MRSKCKAGLNACFKRCKQVTASAKCVIESFINAAIRHNKNVSESNLSHLMCLICCLSSVDGMDNAAAKQ